MKEIILLKNVNLFDVENDSLNHNMDILIEDDTIKKVGKIDYRGKENLQKIDCSEKYALPGLFECHAHLALLTSEDDETKKKIMEDFKITNENEPEKQVLEEFVKVGITQIRDVGGPLENLKHIKIKISKKEILGPDIFYAGPMLEKSPLLWDEHNQTLPGFTVAVDSKEDAKKIIQKLKNKGASLVKTFNKFDLDVFKYLLDQAKEHNLPLTHDPGTTFFHSIPVDLGIDLGIRCFEHAKSPWAAVLKDNLKEEYDQLIDADQKDKKNLVNKIFNLKLDSISSEKLQKLTDKMLEKDVYLCPTLHAFIYMQEKKSEEQNKPMLDILKKLNEISFFFTQKMAKREVKLLVGQDGLLPRFTFNEMQYLKDAGLSESQILKGATIYPAEWLGISENYGSVSPDKKANILILNKNPLEDIQNIKSTHLVLKDGKFVFQ
ncbi:MAG: hypothetical protein AMJ90_02810 [candidate division Zixibacteria bacterium SM23_73_2]|nr:MAG: hypothetical protein AMJ90_02810 [candidate division Zixibacteria bacterium SM23_73_2]